MTGLPRLDRRRRCGRLGLGVPHPERAPASRARARRLGRGRRSRRPVGRLERDHLPRVPGRLRAMSLEAGQRGGSDRLRARRRLGRGHRRLDAARRGSHRRNGLVGDRLELLHRRLGLGSLQRPPCLSGGRLERGAGRDGHRARARGEQRDEFLVQLPDAAEARLGTLVQRPAVEAFHRLGEVGRGEPELGDVVVRGEPGEHLAHQHAERVEVRARVRLESGDHLRREVPVGGLLLLRLDERKTRQAARHPPVHHPQHVGEDDHVLRLEVGVGAQRVRRLERRGELAEKRLHLLEGEGLTLRQPRVDHPPQREPVEEAVGEVGPALVDSEVVHPRERRLHEPARRLHRPRERLTLLGRLHEARVNHLHRDVDAHAARRRRGTRSRADRGRSRP